MAYFCGHWTLALGIYLFGCSGMVPLCRALVFFACFFLSSSHLTALHRAAKRRMPAFHVLGQRTGGQWQADAGTKACRPWWVRIEHGEMTDCTFADHGPRLVPPSPVRSLGPRQGWFVSRKIMRRFPVTRKLSVASGCLATKMPMRALGGHGDCIVLFCFLFGCATRPVAGYSPQSAACAQATVLRRCARDETWASPTSTMESDGWTGD